MDVLNRETIQALATEEDGWHVSIYMPTHRVGDEIQQDPIRLKNLISDAEQDLVDHGMRRPEATGLLSPAVALLDDHTFWQNQSEGLAILVSAQSFYSYRLPLDFDELVVIGDEFYIRPLLSILSGDGRFFVLALSQDEIRLLQGTRYTVAELDLDNVPQSLADALRFEDPESRLQFHTATASFGSGSRPAAFHGTGASAQDDKGMILRYFQQVDAGLQELLADQHAPLVLAGVEYLQPLYRQASSYELILPEGVSGSPEELDAQELHRRAWSLVEPYLLREEQAAADLYRQRANTERASAAPEEIVPAAYDGRIETLFLALDRRLWGTFDPATHQVEIHDEQQQRDRDLLDLAAVSTLLKGGTIYALEADRMPVEKPAAALFRY